MPSCDNQLFDRLPKALRLQLLTQCEPVSLQPGEVLATPGARTRHVYFPTGACVALIIDLDSTHTLQVGMAGCESMLGTQVALGLRHDPLRALVQGAGPAWRMPVEVLASALLRSAPLRAVLLRHVAVLMGQRARAAACAHFHAIGPRLARWLLMCQDRVQADTFPITQQWLATLLGVRRVGVTTAAGALQRAGLIRYHRGMLTICQRNGLLEAACSCYAADLALQR